MASNSESIWEDAGKYLLDVSKLLFAGMFISGIASGNFFNDADVTWIGLGSAVISGIIGFIVIYLSRREK